MSRGEMRASMNRGADPQGEWKTRVEDTWLTALASEGTLILSARPPRHDTRSRWKETPTIPVVARFYGIVIKMYFSQSEHGVPHFHAIYGEFTGVFSMEPLKLIEGDLPARAQRLVTEWAERYRSDLLAMWNTQTLRQLPGLE